MAAAAGNDADFVDYMARETAAAEAAARRAEMEAQHQQWLETTWGGWVTTKFLKMGELPFIQAVAEALQDQKEGKSIPALLLRNFARLAIIFAAILAVFITGKLIQLIIGTEIIVEEQVEIIEEVMESEVTEEKADTKVTTRQNLEDKKTN